MWCTGRTPGSTSERIVIQAFAEDAPHSPALQVGRTAPCPQYSPNLNRSANQFPVNCRAARTLCDSCDGIFGSRINNLHMTDPVTYILEPVGFVHSQLRHREDAPRQGNEDAPEAWLRLASPFLPALKGLQPGAEIVVLTWLHLADRGSLEVHPRNDMRAALTGVFTTRSPDRPNPIGLHRVTVLEIDPGQGLRVQPLEAVDGTPILDIKPVWKD